MIASFLLDYISMYVFYIGLKLEFQKQIEENSSSEKRPFRLMLDVGIEMNVDTLFEDVSFQVIAAFVKSVLKPVVGAKIWNMNFGANKLMSDFVTTSDEAFALLLLENNAAKWLESVEEPDLPKRYRKKAIYSQGGNSGPSWTDDAIDRFVALHLRRERVRAIAREKPDSDLGKRFYAIERYVRTSLGNNDRRALARNKRKLEDIRRKMAGDKDPIVQQTKMRNLALLKATGVGLEVSTTDTMVLNENTMPPIEVAEDYTNSDNITINQTPI